MLSREKAMELELTACEIRKWTMKSIASIGVGHVGGSLDLAELLAVLYYEKMNVRPEEPKWADRDRLVVSKGHAGPAVYSTLGLKGYFPVENVCTLNQFGTDFPSHCDMNHTIGIDMTTGSLGQGISTAMGIAFANKYDKRPNNVYFVIGDGESQEGQIWEAALFAAHRKLDNVIGFLDYNKLQIDGTVDEVCSLGDVVAKFESFGWYVQSIDGHDVNAISEAIDNAKAYQGKPSMIVLNTIKGKGVKRFENQVSCHSTNVTPEILEEALAELDARMEEIRGQKA